MKKTLPILIIGIMLLSVFGATATNTNQVKSTFDDANMTVSPTGPTRDYTHTVMVEVGTATWCPSCPASNSAWHNIYNGGNYDFEYCEMVIDKNSQASSHMNARNLYWVPTSYFDGGEFVEPGTNTGHFYTHLDAAGGRVVPDLEATMTVEWLDRLLASLYRASSRLFSLINITLEGEAGILWALLILTLLLTLTVQTGLGG